MHSANTGDDYIIQVRKPNNFSPADSFHMVYATDGTIGIGHYLLGIDSSWSADLPENCVVITIGHIGNWEMKRRRDFIPSNISKDSTETFGKADKFYLFLKNELIPAIDEKRFNTKDKVLIGHSFGGLFCLYAALQNEKIFDKYYAISPSVWANYYELMKIERNTFDSKTNLSGKISVYAGSLEVFNKVLKSSREFCDTLSSRKYINLQIDLSIKKNANHFSVRKPVVDEILNILKED